MKQAAKTTDMMSPAIDDRTSAETAHAPRRLPWKLLLRLTVTVALIGFLLRSLDFGAVTEALTQIRWELLGLALAVYLVSQLVSSRRWAQLARPLGFSATGSRFATLYFEGMFFSLCLPGSIGGDAVKAFRLGENSSRRILAGCTVLADRFLGLLALTSIGAIALVVKAYGVETPWVWGAALLGLLAPVTGLQLGGRLIQKIHGSRFLLSRFFEKISALQPYWHQQSVLIKGFGYSLLIQLLNVLTVAMLGQSLGIQLPAIAYFVAVPLVSLASSIPISVNGIGIREGGFVWLLAAYGLESNHAMILGMSWTFIVTCSGLVGGVVYLFDSSRADHLERNAKTPRSSKNPPTASYIPAPHSAAMTHKSSVTAGIDGDR